MISLIHPSRGRPEKAFKTLSKWWGENMRGHDFEQILSIDEDDPSLSKYLELFPIGYRVIINKNRSAVDAINKAAKVASGDLLLVMSDDTECPDNWIQLLSKEIEGKKDFILKTQDGIQPWIITMPIMDRDYYNRFGYIYYPGYQHLFADTELTCVADITGRKITSNLLFPHKHYSVTKEQPDEINKKADATWKQGEKLFLERYARNFDLPKGGRIEGQAMIDWLQRKAK